MDTNQNKFSEKLASLRKSKSMSQEQLAEKINVSRQAVSKWETGEAKPDMDKLIQLSETLEISIDQLCTDKHFNNSNKQETFQAKQNKQSFVLRALIYFALVTTGIIIGAVSCYFLAVRDTPKNNVPDNINNYETYLDKIEIIDLRCSMQTENASEYSVPFHFTIVTNATDENITAEILCISLENDEITKTAEFKNGTYTADITLKKYNNYGLYAVFTYGDISVNRPLMEISNIQSNSYSSVDVWM